MTVMDMLQLSIEEATPLAAVLCQRIADTAGIPMLNIKGDAFIELGIRPTRTASDLDLLIHPDSCRAFCSALEAHGWDLRSDDPGGHYANHSSTYFHPQWPVDIDVHHRFPGISGEPVETFELLWKVRQSIELASQRITTVSTLDAMLIQALNSLRNPWKALDRSDFEFLLERTPPELALELKNRSTELGCLAEVKPYIVFLDPSLQTAQWPRASTEWRARNTASTVGALRIIDIVDARGIERFRLIRLAVFPSMKSLVSKSMTSNSLQTEPWQMMKLGARRAKAFLSDLPRTAKVLYEYYHHPDIR